MTPITRRQLLSLCAFAALPLAGSEPHPVIPAYNQFSDDDEISLGRDVTRQMEKERKLKVLDVPDMQEYVESVFQRVVQSSRRPNLPYSIKIVDTSAVNACAYPGGFVYLNRGLMEFAQTESELMGVLAHEVGHVVARHGINNVCREAAADSLVSEASRILLGDVTPAQILKRLGGPLVALALLKYSRDQESEADLLGFYNVQRAGWSPSGMLTFFRRISGPSSELESIMAFKSDHPASSERAESIRNEMRIAPPSGDLAASSDAFKAMQAELKRLAPPPRANQSLNGY